MQVFHYENSEFFVEGVPLAEIAEAVGTPFYVYSQRHLTDQLNAVEEALGDRPHLTCFALKANNNP